MMRLAQAFNLRIGQRDLSYQDVIRLVTTGNEARVRVAATMLHCTIPSNRGSHSDISGT